MDTNCLLCLDATHQLAVAIPSGSGLSFGIDLTIDWTLYGLPKLWPLSRCPALYHRDIKPQVTAVALSIRPGPGPQSPMRSSLTVTRTHLSGLNGLNRVMEGLFKLSCVTHSRVNCLLAYWRSALTDLRSHRPVLKKLDSRPRNNIITTTSPPLFQDPHHHSQPLHPSLTPSSTPSSLFRQPQQPPRLRNINSHTRHKSVEQQLHSSMSTPSLTDFLHLQLL